MTIDTVLSDIDGTLVDSNGAHALAWLDALEAVGRSSTYDRIFPLIGMGADKLLPVLGIEPNSPAGREAGDRAARLFLEKYLADVKVFPNVRALLERVRKTMKLVAATSADDKEVDAILHHASLVDLFDRTTSSDDAKESKPSPDIVVAALERIHAKSNAAIMLGDTPYDVDAAKHANVKCIALRCGGHDDASLGGAVEIHDDPASLLRADSSILWR